jgi:hypothetical protein
MNKNPIHWLIDDAMRNQGCRVEQPHRMESLTSEEEQQVKWVVGVNCGGGRSRFFRGQVRRRLPWTMVEDDDGREDEFLLFQYFYEKQNVSWWRVNRMINLIVRINWKSW